MAFAKLTTRESVLVVSEFDPSVIGGDYDSYTANGYDESLLELDGEPTRFRLTPLSPAQADATYLAALNREPEGKRAGGAAIMLAYFRAGVSLDDGTDPYELDMEPSARVQLAQLVYTMTHGKTTDDESEADELGKSSQQSTPTHETTTTSETYDVSLADPNGDDIEDVE
jgi:hypothetical protein